MRLQSRDCLTWRQDRLEEPLLGRLPCVAFGTSLSSSSCGLSTALLEHPHNVAASSPTTLPRKWFQSEQAEATCLLWVTLRSLTPFPLFYSHCTFHSLGPHPWVQPTFNGRRIRPSVFKGEISELIDVLNHHVRDTKTSRYTRIMTQSIPSLMPLPSSLQLSSSS